MTPFDEALSEGGLFVAAWDHLDEARTKLYLLSVGDEGVKVVARANVSVDEHEKMVDRLTARGVRIGGTYGSNTFAWVADDQGFAVWSPEKLLASGVNRSNVADVTLFVDPTDQGHRGVWLTRGTGQREVLAEEHDPTPRLDPAYGHDELFVDSLWARFLGETLAVWFLVPLVDEVSGDPIEADLKIARAAREVADLVRVGSSGTIVKSVGQIGRVSELAFRFESGRLEIVTTLRGGTTSSASLKRGTNEQIVAFLLRVTTPATTLWAMNELIRGSR